MLETEAVQIDVGALEHVGRRQHEVGELAGGVAVQIDGDQQIE